MSSTILIDFMNQHPIILLGIGIACIIGLSLIMVGLIPYIKHKF